MLYNNGKNPKVPRLIIDLTEAFAIIGGIEANCRFCIVDGSQTKHEFEVKLIYSEKATKFCEIFTLLLTVCIVVKRKVKISQTFVAFSEYMSFNFKKNSRQIDKNHSNLEEYQCCLKI